MKRFLLGAMACTSMFVSAQTLQNPLWLRDVAISPDGSKVAFTFKGDIYTVPVSGGEARRITTHKGYDSMPVWSPDGSRIVFRSDREGTDDIYAVESGGGTPVRLTTASGAETPLAFISGNKLLFSMSDLPARESIQPPFLGQTFILDVDSPGTRPSMYLSMPMKTASVNKEGGLLYADKKGVEDPLRKHERSSGTSDIWLYKDGKFDKLTDFNGHDLDAVWAADGKHFYYISEEDGTLNVFSRNLDGTEKKQLTNFTKHPVRSLSAAGNGMLAFSWDGEIYTLREGEAPVKVNVKIATDNYDSDLVKKYVNAGASNIAVSPSGNEVAFVLRGDIYVTDTKHKTTRRITDTAGQERCLSFSPDGRSLVYDSDRDGYWQLFISSIKNKDEKQFAYASEIEETPLYKCSTSAQQPEFSPDGTKVAFWENRDALRVIDVKSKAVNTALDAKHNYSYADGDLSYSWSPDSKWLLSDYFGEGGWHNRDVALVKADGSEVIDLTESGFNDGLAKWVMNGEGIIYLTSKYGMKSQGSWGNTDDVLFMALTPAAWDKLNMTEEELEISEKEADEADKDKKDKDKKKKDKKKEAVKSPEFDTANRRYRIKRLTGSSAYISDFWMNPRGSKLYYIAESTEGKSNLYVRDLKKDNTSVLSEGLSGGILADSVGKNLFLLSDGDIKKVDVESGKTEKVEFDALYDRHPSLEREYMYDHMLRQVNDKFYDADLHGVDWAGYGEHYRKFLPYISNNRDFATLLSEILGELNASHTGGRAYGNGASMPAAVLGAYFDNGYQGDGIKVSEVLARGPLSTAEADVAAGDIILSIDGEKIAPGQDINPMLEGKAGKKVALMVKKADGKEKRVSVRPISLAAQNRLAYERWVEKNEQIVDSLSEGRVGYVHIKGMDSPSYRVAYERLLGKYRNCDAVIVDTRHNGGGWLHNDLAILLSGKEYCKFMPRGRYIGSEPFSQWHKPSVMLVNEANYSDAHGSPFAYQSLKIGDVVGAPIPGTMTAVWWETQIDPSIVFGIPQVTNANLQGVPMENNQLNPDVLIYNEPSDVLKGYDAQLAGAVRHLLEKVDAMKK